MAINPNDWDWTALITPAPAYVAEPPPSRYPRLLTAANFAPNLFTYLETDARSLRFTSDRAGQNELPFGITRFDHASGIIEVWVLQDTADQPLWYWVGNSAAAPYAVNATYGRNAVFADYAFAYRCSGATVTDLSGKSSPVVHDGRAATIEAPFGGLAMSTWWTHFVDTQIPTTTFAAGREWSICQFVHVLEPTDPSLEYVYTSSQVFSDLPRTGNFELSYAWGGDSQLLYFGVDVDGDAGWGGIQPPKRMFASPYLPTRGWNTSTAGAGEGLLKILSGYGQVYCAPDAGGAVPAGRTVVVCGGSGWGVGEYALAFGRSGAGPDIATHRQNNYVWQSPAASATSSALEDAAYTYTREFTVTFPAGAIGGLVSFYDADDAADPVRLGELLGGPFTLTTASYTWTHTQAPGEDVFIAFVPDVDSALLELAQRVVVADASTMTIAMEIEEVDEL